ncbi:glycosyltransferase family 2 protein [Acinetobacter sp. CUI P1]|nr:glycosyltransferase family 2 protein [Acinetobacter sp. CUI P1]
MISIIVPVYNTGEKLERCLNSLLNQTLEEIEIIVVNDGSNDNKTVDMCNKFQQIDSRVRVINKENGGVSSARNKGLDEAHGQFVMFVDSDDYIENTTCFELWEALIVTSSCTSMSGFIREFYSNDKLINSKKIYPNCDHILCESDFNREFGQLYSKTLNVSVCAKLYNLSIIVENNIKFNEDTYLGEDMLFNFEYFRFTKIISVVNKGFYHYVCDESSSLTSKYDLDKFQFNKMLFESSIRFSEEMEIGKDSNSVISKIYLRGCFRNIESVFSSNCKLTSAEKKMYIKRIINDESTKKALKARSNDYEYVIYKSVLSLKIVSFVKLFSYIRLEIKKKVRGS